MGKTRGVADWNRLSIALASAGASARFTWDELAAVVGELPASATKHRAWWSGDRPHVRTWARAGFEIANLVPGHEVTFVRVSAAPTSAGSELAPEPAELAERSVAPDATLLLITCVKEKLSSPAAARELYVSSLFSKQLAYAEGSGLPWFILSAEHGLVAPDEWLAPYERYLPDTPKPYRKVWGAWVVERLELLSGSLRGHVLEVHAGQTYVDPLRDPLADKGAALVEPLAGLTMGQRLGWYPKRVNVTGQPHPALATGGAHSSTDQFCLRLTSSGAAVSPTDFVARGPDGLRVPGLYSWWVDEPGAVDLSAGLGHAIRAGLIYAGLAGATRWPSGRRSTNTLWSRITGMHLGGRHEFSTFRRSLGSILTSARGKATIDEEALTAWMHAHLTVIAVPFDDADTLGHLEGDVLSRLDPPLNLQGMITTPTRRRLKELRRPHGKKTKGAGATGGA